MQDHVCQDTKPSACQAVTMGENIPASKMELVVFYKILYVFYKIISNEKIHCSTIDVKYSVNY